MTEIYHPSSEREKQPRIAGFDLARAIAILGMCLVHFTLVMSSARTEPAALPDLITLLDGRAAALFVILSGIGVSLRTRHAAQSGEPQVMAHARRGLVRRGVVLLIAGFLNLLIWQGDILRVYGVSLLVASAVFGMSNRRLLVASIAFISVFPVLLFTVDYGTNWDWNLLTYHGLWSPEGLIRNLFYDGFRSVFPWTGLFLLGMWLGRYDWSDRLFRRQVLVVSLVTGVATEGISRILRSFFTRNPGGMEADTIAALFGTESMPPLLLFLCAAVAFAAFMIASSLWIAERFAGSYPVRALVATGQMALTWYITHIVLGLGFVIACGWSEHQPLAASIAAALAYFFLAMLISDLWRRRGRPGPLEWGLRRIAG